MSTSKLTIRDQKFPMRGWLGLLLIATFWYINWSFDGLRTHVGFFPLWLGYCLLVDALTYMRKGNSLISRSFIGYFFLFVISAPAWWLFELINEQAQYWHYTAREQFTDLEYFFFASLSFSTVIPAIFGTSELMGTFAWIQKLGKGPRIGKKSATIRVLFVLGLLMLICVFVFPKYSAAFIWMSLYLMLDPINHWMGKRTLLQRTAKRNWREVIALWTGSLVCGFFWEMWNVYSNPKWYYTVPYVDFWYVFEMPLLGYLGYLPFALELFALYHLVMGLITSDQWQNYLQLLPRPQDESEATD